MGIDRLAALAARTNGLALAGLATILLTSVVGTGDRLEKCRGKVVLDACRNVTEIISAKGYPVEEHNVITEDGYILTLIRIPWGLMGPGIRRRPVVFLQHGLVCSAADWVINLPHQSLAFILADAGYDVWLGNIRGNMYSSHVSLEKTNSKFWDFCFDDMITFDLPAMIDYVLEKTNSRRLFYVGHSQGTMILFGLLSERPEYNQKITLFCALAPVTTVTYMISPMRLLAPIGASIKRVLGFFGRHHFVKNSRVVKFAARTSCNRRFSRRFCEAAMFVIAGMEERSLNMTRLPVIISHFPAGTSCKNVAHYGQLIQSKRFQKYDYGRLKNFLFYGQRRPPEYDLTKVTAPVAIFYGRNDWFCDLRDVRQLEEKLPNVVLSYQVPDPRFTHLDFNFGVFARRQVYEPMMRLMRRFVSTVNSEGIALVPLDITVGNEPSFPIPADIAGESDHITGIPVENAVGNQPTAKISAVSSAENEPVDAIPFAAD